jgi:hypothetical protein
MKMPVADTSENRNHKIACFNSEQLRMSAVDAALAAQRAGGSSTTATAAIIAAEKAHYLRLAASAIANGVSNGAEFVQSAAFVGTHA